MRILHIITSTDIGGAQSVVIDLCKMAVKDINTVAVASMLNGPLWEQLPKEVEQFHLPHMVKPIKPLKEILCFFEIRKTIKSFKPDIIHLHSSKAALLGRLACPLRLIKRIVYTVHGFDTIRIRNRVFLPLEKLLQKRCGAIVPVSEYDKNNLISEGITHNVSLIRNAVSEAPKTPQDELPPSISQALATNKKIILTIARIALPKRLDIFTDMASILQENTSVKPISTTSLQTPLIQTSSIWVGSPTDNTLDTILAECKAKNVAVFTGDIPDATRLLPYADIFVLFSNYEGLPITILEAMSHGKPIIATNVGGISELVDDNNGTLLNLYNKDGSFINSHEVAFLAASEIKKLLSNNELYQKKCDASLRKYKENFTLEKMWIDYKNTYQKLIDLI